MSGLQRFAKWLFPTRLHAAIEAESRSWKVRCPKCGHETDIWSMGGVRYKAAGVSWSYLRCPACGRRSWHKIYRPRPAPAKPPS